MWLVIAYNLFWQSANVPLQEFNVEFAVFNVITTTRWVNAPERPGWQKLENHHTYYTSLWDLTYEPRFGSIRIPVMWNRGYVRQPPGFTFPYQFTKIVHVKKLYVLQTDFDWEYENRGIYFPVHQFPNFPYFR